MMEAADLGNLEEIALMLAAWCWPHRCIGLIWRIFSSIPSAKHAHPYDLYSS